LNEEFFAMNGVFDRIILIAWILVGSGAGTVLYYGLNSQATSEGGGTGIQAAYGVFYVIFVLLLAFSFRTALSLVMEERWLIILWLWALASMAWSPLPGTTLRRCAALLGTTIAGLFVATRFDAKQQLKIVAHCVGITAIVSLVVCQLYPEYAIAPTGEWIGVFNQKNALGRAMELGIFCYTFLAIAERRGRASYLVMIGLCGSMMFMSRSVGSMAVCAAMLAVIPFRKLLVLRARSLMLVAAGLLVVGVPIGIYVIQNIESILKAMGRDATLTGRIPLWHEVIAAIGTHPWFGYGYSAFWYTSAGIGLQQKLGWQMFHAHDGFLEVTLGLGLIGILLLFVVLAKNALRGISVARDSETIYDFWPLFYLVFAVLDNLTECWLITANSLVWMLFVANSYWLVRRSHEAVTEEEEDREPEPESEFILGMPAGINPVES
jgi:exopolysaccharide production protein ExoQ